MGGLNLLTRLVLVKGTPFTGRAKGRQKSLCGWVLSSVFQVTKQVSPWEEPGVDSVRGGPRPSQELGTEPIGPHLKEDT